MRFKSIITILLLLIAMCSFGQKAYTDSIKAYQRKYIAELQPIIKNDTAHIRFHPITPSYKIKATVKILSNQPSSKITTSSGKTKEAQKYALVNFLLGGRAYQLFAYQLLVLKNKVETANLFFIPFIDKTSGNLSYGGGRYIDFKTDDISKNGLLINFNKAYNPYCAFAKGYNCPVPPRENLLNAAIKAGERYLANKFEH